MIGSLAKQFSLRGKPRRAVIELIGEPNGESVMFDTPWALSARFEWGWFDLGYMFYWPTKAYPVEHLGHVTPVGDWMFEHF